jgi:hypothetical protein
MKNIVFLFLLFSVNTIAQSPVEKITAVKKSIELQLKNTTASIPDSVSAICSKKYIAALDSVAAIYQLHNKMEIDFPFEKLWQMANNTTATRDALIVAILKEKDSVLYAALGNCDLLIAVPDKQTECCAIPGHTEYDAEKAKTMDPLILTALSLSNSYQNFNYSNFGKDSKSALLQMIDNGLVNNEYVYASKNGYSKLSKLVDSLMNPDKKNTTQMDKVKRTDKKQPIWLWLLGGFVFAVLLFFILTKRKEKEIAL